MLVLLFCELSEQYSQTNFPTIKTKPLQQKKEWQMCAKIKSFVIILSFLLKNKNKDTH